MDAMGNTKFISSLTSYNRPQTRNIDRVIQVCCVLGIHVYETKSIHFECVCMLAMYASKHTQSINFVVYAC